MIECVVALPYVGRYLQFPGGMKSGWGLTANDNTLLHAGIFRVFKKEMNYKNLHAKLYGDDNFAYKKLYDPQIPRMEVVQ